MRFIVNLDGFDGQEIVLESGGLLRGSRLLVDGKPAKKGNQRGQFVLTDNNGFKVPVYKKHAFLDPIPRLVVDDEEYRFVEPLTAFQWIWCGIPLILIFIGGAIGGLIGGVAFWLNTHVFRSETSGLEKYVLVGLISLIAFLAYLIIAALFQRAILSLI
jgi:hypothetical protein